MDGLEALHGYMLLEVVLPETMETETVESGYGCHRLSRLRWGVSFILSVAGDVVCTEMVVHDGAIVSVVKEEFFISFTVDGLVVDTNNVDVVDEKEEVVDNVVTMVVVIIDNATIYVCVIYGVDNNVFVNGGTLVNGQSARGVEEGFPNE
ncbi:hypothetical protein NDU88_006077 [Pleurodeles waltl]|uniref:Uncharacterized protein n=1 Tax=Pleurodeles waltl TaxID=8319 RepID=A0AAV7L9C8_PLEWA|nr:hypothetical protein NDU88_006077 [Pleurodeles waltl]